MKLCIGILLLAATWLRAQATNDLTALLQQGLFEEQASRNLDAAIADYQSLAAQFDKDRQLAATAVFRLGECYRAQGRTNEAAAQYQRILHDFSDQQTLTTLSRQDLAGMGISGSQASAGDAQRQQKELLAKQIALAEQDLADTQKMFQVGKAVQADVRAAEREMLRLRQQLAALDSNKAELLDLSAPASSEEDQEIAHIQQMIQNSPDLINAPSQGYTPLVTAAYNGRLKVAAYLLDHGADVNIPASDVRWTSELSGRVTPLMAAVGAGNKAMAKFLIDRGADINFKGQYGDTPLHLAAKKGFQAVTEVLLASHTDVNAQNNSGTTPLFSAVQGSQLKVVQMLLAAGANANLKDGNGRTGLNYAIGTSSEIFKALLDAGTNPNTEDSDGRTPLSYAVERDSPEVVKLLLATKADPNGGQLDAPLLCAISKQSITSAELLLQAGAKPNAMGTVSYSNGSRKSVNPLYVAISQSQLPMVQLLLKYKADPNDSQTDGKPLLFNALSDTNMLGVLLDAGANIESHDATIRVNGDRPNWTPLAVAAWEQRPGPVEILLKRGANPNASDAIGNVPLHWAVSFLRDPLTDQNCKMVESLLNHGADPNVRNSAGFTPLDWVKRRLGQYNGPVDKVMSGKIADLLRQHGALDKLPDWDRITFSRPANNYSATVFQKNTNDWNHFTLLELLYWIYPNGSYSSLDGSASQFPDLAHIVISRPSTNGMKLQRITVNVLNDTNGVDCARDVTLEFGDVVEIPEREHTLAEGTTYLSREQEMTILNYFRSLAGEAKLILEGGPTVQLPLQPFFSQIGRVIASGNARAALTSNCDLSRVKVTRRDPKTLRKYTWILDCRNRDTSGMIELWVRAGDVIEVPLKP